MANIFRIPSRLYFELYQKGGDRLISVYAILKKAKKNDVKYYAFTSKNGKKVTHYNLIRSYTGLTLHSIKKYTDVLIELGLCSFHDNGDFVLVGNQKLKRLYNNKMIPVIIGKNIVETSYSSFLVRVHSNSKQQQLIISKKTHQRVLKNKKEEDLTYPEIKERKRLEKKKEKGFFIDKSVLSIKKFAVLKDNSKNNKCKGQYWKQKLINASYIESTRRFEVLRHIRKFQFEKEELFLPKYLKYYKGNLIKEVVSEIKVKTIVKKQS